MTALSRATSALDSRDRDAFAEAVAELPGTPDDHFVYNHPLIGWVARQGWGDGVEVLIEAGSDPKNVPGVLQMGIFPTYLYETDVRPLELLIEAGADVNEYVPDRMGTPLQCASFVIEDRGAAIAALLLKNGADPNLAPGNSATPLFNACVRPCVDTVRLLLEAGADPDAGDDEVTPMHAAISELVNAIRRSENNPEDNSAEVAQQFVPPTVSLLVKHGADVTATLNGRDVMWRLLAMAECPPGMMETVLDAGAPTDGTLGFNDEEIDYLAFAFYRGAPVSVLRRLVAAGCPLDSPYATLSNYTVAGALSHWSPDDAMSLWDEFDTFGDALIKARTPKGASALDLAAVGTGHEALVRRLHAAGVKLTAATADGKSTLDLVQEYQPQLVPVIEELQAAEQA